MADSEKKDSSKGDAKAKLSLLDEDFSKDFLSSWKSGSDDMDFNFEPVSKGKKKAFDFGMDMDFSLDDAFGKMPSFKMDMPDIDFSSSPKKFTKSKENSDRNSSKGSRQDKLDKFSFSFDFDGMDIGDEKNEPGDSGRLASAKLPSDNVNASASTDTKALPSDPRSSAEMQKAPFDSEPTTAKTVLLKNKDPGDMNSKFPVVEAINDDGRTECSVSEDNREGSTHIGAVNRSCSSNGSRKHNGKELYDHPSCTKELIQSDSIMKKSEKNTAVRTSPRDHDETLSGDNRNEVIIDAVPYDDEVEAEAEAAEDGYPSLESENRTNNFKSSRDKDFSLDGAFGKMTSVKMDMPDIDISKSPKKSTKSKETSEEDSAIRNSQDNHNTPTFSFNFKRMNGSDQKNVSGDGGCLGSAKLLSVNDSTPNDTKALSANARSSPETQKPSLKVSSTAFGSVPSIVQTTNDGDRTELTASGDNHDSSTHIGAVNRSVSISRDSYGSNTHNGKKLDDHPSSCTEELIQSDSVMENSEKNTAARTPPRDPDETVSGKDRNEVSVDAVPHYVKAAKDGPPSIECDKMTNNVKSSGFKIPSSAPAELETKLGNQGQGDLKDRISSMGLGQKFNIGQGNKLSSQKMDKKMFSLPSLKIARRTTTDKRSAAPTVLSNAKIVGSVEKSTGLQAMIKTVTPFSAKKQTYSTPSLKRKSSEAAVMDPAKLHTPKRFSPSESRMSKVSSREPEDEVHIQGHDVEGSAKNVSAENKTPKLIFDQEANMAALQFSLMVENDANVEKAEACAKELDNICNMLKKKHEEAKELMVRTLVNNNYLLMLSHPIYDEKICAVQRLASKLMSMELEKKA